MSPRWFILAALFLGSPAAAWDWGVHYRIALGAGVDATAAHGVSFPDMVRDIEKPEYPRHYMNEDFFPAGFALGSLPITYAAFAPRVTVPVDKMGVLLYEILYYVQEHRRELAAGKTGDFRVMELRLAHYVGDLSMPLHLTGNYNGQWTGQKGAHERFENFADKYLLDVTPTPTPAVRSDADLWARLQDQARRSRSLAPDLLVLDKKALACPDYDACFRPAMPVLQAQLNRSAGLLQAMLEYARQTTTAQTDYRHHE